MPRVLGLLTPLCVAAALVVTEFGGNSAGHWTTLVRPLVLAVAGAALVEALLLVALRRFRTAVMGSTAIVLLLVGDDAVMIGTAAILAAWLIFAAVQRVRSRPMPASYHPAVGGIAAITLLLSVAQTAMSGAIVVTPQSARAASGSGAQGPSIYVVVLDAYPRQDTLAELGHDNEPFLGALEGLGFDVHRDSRSNYDHTAPTLASMLDLRPIDEIPGMPPPGSSWQAQSAALMHAMNDGRALDLLRERGYRTVSIPPVASYVGLYAADEVRDTGHLTDFERHLLTDTAMAGLVSSVAPDWIAEQHRGRIRAAFDAIDPQPSGTFTWAHVMAPHAPFVFAADGSAKPMPTCFPRCWFWAPWGELDESEFADGLIPQLEYTNGQVLEAVGRIVESDPSAVVVVMGDHGTRFGGAPEERFRNLLAVRTPGKAQLLGSAPTLVNVLPAIFDAYLGTDLPRVADAQFSGPGTVLVEIDDVN